MFPLIAGMLARAVVSSVVKDVAGALLKPDEKSGQDSQSITGGATPSDASDIG